MGNEDGIKFMMELIKQDILENTPPPDSTFEYPEEDYQEDIDKIKTVLGSHFDWLLDELVYKSRRLGMVEVWHELRSTRDGKSK